MIRTIEFEMDPDGRWYAIIPEWTGDREELEMVCGADLLIGILAGEWNTVRVKFSTEPFPECKTLIHDKSGNDLGWYSNDAWHGPSTIWLCHVTEFVFGSYPDRIYYC